MLLVYSINLFSSHSFWWSHTHCIKLVVESTTINNSFSFHIVHGRPHIAHTHTQDTQICTHTAMNVMYWTIDCTFTHHHNTPQHTLHRMKFINHMNRNVYGPNKTFSITMHPPECSSVDANKCYYGLYSFTIQVGFSFQHRDSTIPIQLHWICSIWMVRIRARTVGAVVYSNRFMCWLYHRNCIVLHFWLKRFHSLESGAKISLLY